MERLADCVILPAGPGDAAELARVHVASWRETYDGILPSAYLAAMRAEPHARRWRRELTAPSRGDIVLAVESSRGLVGYCAGAVSGAASGAGEAEVFTLYLMKAVQGAGIGRQLLCATAKVLHARGARSLGLWVLDANRAARGFYERLGGRPAGHRPVTGWGGRLSETAYRWETIEVLSGAAG